MSIIGNILWLIFGGLLATLGYWLGGVLLLLTIIGIPFGLQVIRIGTANLVPFGKTVESDPSSGILAWVFDIIWLLTFGLGIAVAHVVSAAALVVTIIGIPFAWQHIKLVPVALLPFRFVLRDA